MTPDDEADRLAAIAVELACRVRDDGAEEVSDWLRRVLRPEDWYRLPHVLAAAVPIDRPWKMLTAWTVAPRLQYVPEPQGLYPCGTWPAAKRHRYYKEPLDDACREAERRRGREQAAKKRACQMASTHSSTGSVNSSTGDEVGCPQGHLISGSDSATVAA